MQQAHAIVSGNVQGVSFRYYTVRKASELGLQGFVKNLADGRVEVVAQGSKEQLEEMIEWLKSGPSGSNVEDVRVEWSETKEKITGFSVKY